MTDIFCNAFESNQQRKYLIFNFSVYFYVVRTLEQTCKAFLYVNSVRKQEKRGHSRFRKKTSNFKNRLHFCDIF
jgi:hypothetical protein